MALPNPTLKDLATIINKNVSLIDTCFENSSLPKPSFSIDGLRKWDHPELQDAQESRIALIDAATDLLHLTLGPNEYLRSEYMAQKYDFFIIGALNRYNVFESVPLKGSITYADLAKKCEVTEARLKRWIRHAISKRIFWAPSQNTVAHTITSAELAQDESAWAWLGHNTEEIGPAAAKIMEQNDKYGDSRNPAEAAIMLTIPEGTAKDLFAWVENDGIGEPELSAGKIDKFDRTKGWRARRFGHCMKFLTSGGGYSSAHVNDFDWDALGDATVVDMGGSSGHLAFELASKHTNLRITVQDLPNLQAQFKDNVPSSLQSRVSFQVHDFMGPQTITADVYLFRHIFHDWPDNLSAKIIQNVVPVMKKGTRIIVMDGVMPEPGETSNFVLRANTSMDLQMMTAFNAKERTKDDWVDLFHEADKRLVVKQFLQPRGSTLALIEVVFEG